jgi:streptomycin 6-kinase
VLERGRGWLLEQAIDAQPLQGEEAMAAAAAAAARIADLKLPEAPPSARRGLAQSLRRRALLLRSRLPLGDLLRAKRILRGVTRRVPSHGDLHPGNILFADGAAWVVDWELSGLRPRGYDLLHLWATLERDEDRELLVSPESPELKQLRYAVTVEVIASKLSAEPVFNRDPEGASRLLQLLPGLRAEAARA